MMDTSWWDLTHVQKNRFCQSDLWPKWRLDFCCAHHWVWFAVVDPHHDNTLVAKSYISTEIRYIEIPRDKVVAFEKIARHVAWIRSSTGLITILNGSQGFLQVVFNVIFVDFFLHFFNQIQLKWVFTPCSIMKEVQDCWLYFSTGNVLLASTTGDISIKNHL